jgi:hypothetical protein
MEITDQGTFSRAVNPDRRLKPWKTNPMDSAEFGKDEDRRLYPSKTLMG